MQLFGKTSDASGAVAGSLGNGMIQANRSTSPRTRILRIKSSVAPRLSSPGWKTRIASWASSSSDPLARGHDHAIAEGGRRADHSESEPGSQPEKAPSSDPFL